MPIDFPNCALWLRAKQLTLADAAAVSNWNDLSGNGFDMVQATGANQPVFRINQTPSGHPAVDFDRDSFDYLRYAGQMTTALAGDLFVVVRMADAGQDIEHIFLSSSDEASNDFNMIRFRNRATPANNMAISTIDATTATTITATTTDMAAATWYIVNYRSDGTQYFMRCNNVAQAFTVGQGDNDGDWFGDRAGRDNVVIAARQDVTGLQEYGNGQIAEIILYDRFLSDDENRRIQYYLASEHGLTI